MNKVCSPTKYHQPNRLALFKLLAHVQWSATSDRKPKGAKASTAKQPAKKSMKKQLKLSKAPVKGNTHK